MIDNILHEKVYNIQRKLALLGHELSHKVFGLMDCNPELKNNPHVVKAEEKAINFVSLFAELLIVLERIEYSKEGGL